MASHRGLRVEETAENMAHQLLLGKSLFTLVERNLQQDIVMN
jgi:hypothetical protein